jgi:hypothetical protein
VTLLDMLTPGKPSARKVLCITSAEHPSGRRQSQLIWPRGATHQAEASPFDRNEIIMASSTLMA